MKRFAIIIGILSGFLFGVATLFSKLLLANLNSFQLAGLLYLGAGLAMVPYILKKTVISNCFFGRIAGLKPLE